MVIYDGKEIGNTEGFMLREKMSVYQYHQTLQKVQSGELLRLRPGVFAEPATLADTMLDIDVLVPGGVLCMYSAWEHYELTTQIPSAFCIAIPRKRKLVLPEFPPITLYYWSDHLLGFGTTTAEVHGHKVRVTDLERSVCDAIKYRNKNGLDVCAEILKAYLHRTDRNIAKLIEYAKMLRVAATLKTYLEIGL
jgi:predicted transcriptional regulator of viral defense system